MVKQILICLRRNKIILETHVIHVKVLFSCYTRRKRTNYETCAKMHGFCILYISNVRINNNPSKRPKAGHYRPAGETSLESRFAGGPLVARDGMLAGIAL